MSLKLKLTAQQKKVYTYILEHRGCTTKDIMLGTGIQCPSGRIAEMRGEGVDIISVGQKKYEGSKAFEMYAIGKPIIKTISTFEIRDGVVFEKRVVVNV